MFKRFLIALLFFKSISIYANQTLDSAINSGCIFNVIMQYNHKKQFLSLPRDADKEIKFAASLDVFDSAFDKEMVKNFPEIDKVNNLTLDEKNQLISKVLNAPLIKNNRGLFSQYFASCKQGSLKSTLICNNDAKCEDNSIFVSGNISLLKYSPFGKYVDKLLLITKKSDTTLTKALNVHIKNINNYLDDQSFTDCINEPYLFLTANKNKLFFDKETDLKIRSLKKDKDTLKSVGNILLEKHSQFLIGCNEYVKKNIEKCSIMKVEQDKMECKLIVSPLSSKVYFFKY